MNDKRTSLRSISIPDPRGSRLGQGRLSALGALAARWARGLGRLLLGLALLVSLLSAGEAAASGRYIVIASTTSTENSGLFAHILPLFTAKTGIAVRVVAVGTGQAIRMARRGDADVLLVHDTPSEERFVAEGFGVERFDVMSNDFVLVGPASDSAGIGDLKDAADAFARIAKARAAFISRGDDSGTHKAELRIWRTAGIEVAGESGTWYREAGAGMGATLNTATMLEAYVLADRGTWLSFNNRVGMSVLVEGDPRLFNQYGVIALDPARFPHVKARDARAFVDWLISTDGQEAIAAFRIGDRQAFFPNARGPRS